MTEETRTTETSSTPWGLLLLGLGGIGATELVRTLQAVRMVVLMLLTAAPLVGGVWYRRWFPLGATGELNKVMRTTPLDC